MAESVYKVIELIGTSKDSWEKAAAAAINRAGKSLRDLRVAEVVQLDLQLDRDQTFADALQTKINSLTTDFVNRDDPAQRAVLERDRQKSIAEVNRLKKAIADDKKAIADLEEEARRAGVPPGWLR